MAWSNAERGILTAHRLGDFARCTELSVRFARPFILAHLRKAVPDEALVEEAFAEWSELVATSWAKFDGQHSVSTWLYVLARRPRRRAIEERARRVQREAELDSAVVDPGPRLATAPHLRTTVKQAFRELWEDLTSEDRELLRLRVEEGKSWEEVARTLRGPKWQPTADELKRETQVLAARYKRRVKDVLAERASSRGLLQQYGVE